MLFIELTKCTIIDAFSEFLGTGNSQPLGGRLEGHRVKTPSRTRALAITKPSGEILRMPGNVRVDTEGTSFGATACQMKSEMRMLPTSPIPLSRTSRDNPTRIGFGDVESQKTTGQRSGSRRSSAAIAASRKSKTPKSLATILPLINNNRIRELTRPLSARGTLKPSDTRSSHCRPRREFNRSSEPSSSRPQAKKSRPAASSSHNGGG